MANVDTNEEFWGITLTGERKVHTWNPVEAEEDVEHKIQVTQACLGQKAKEGERNVIEVTTEDDDGKKISCAIVSLRVGFAECMHLELGFTNPVKFMLKEGNGPISLCGVHLSALPLDLDKNDMESSEDEDDEEVPQLVKVANSKAKVEELPDDKVQEKEVEATPVKKIESVPAVAAVVSEEKKEAAQVAETKNAKKRALPEVEEEEVSAKKKKEESKKEDKSQEEKKVEVVKELEEEDDDDADDDDEDNEDDDEEDDDEDDEDDEEDEDNEDDMDDIDMEDLDAKGIVDVDSDDMESDDEEEDEDEESEEETPKPKKKPPPKVNGVPPKKEGKVAASTTKLTPKGKPSANKENVNTNKDATPKVKADIDGPKKNATTPKRTPEELRTFLLKSPNLPKKYEKFSNFLKNNMKVTDAKTQKELWEYVQKNKK